MVQRHAEHAEHDDPVIALDVRAGGQRIRLPSPRVEGISVAGLVALVVVSRLPLRTRYLLNWDADQFALGLSRFDVVHHQPHPPGYVGYEAIGRLLVAIVHDPNWALILLSIVGEAAAVLLTYGFAREVFGRTVGLVAGLGQAFSPLYWYYGEAANTYALEPACAVAVAWLCWRARAGDVRAARLAAVVLAGSGALRPSTTVLLLPLLLWSLHRGLHRDEIVRCLGSLAVVGMAWVVPLLLLTGGPARYLEALLALGTSDTSGTALWRAGLPALVGNVSAVALGVAWELGILSVPALYSVAVLPWLRGDHRVPSDWGRFSLLWVAAPLLVFSLVHIGQVAYVQVFTPLLFVEAGIGITAGVQVVGRPRSWPVVAALATVVNVAIFFLPPTYSLAGQLREHDAEVEALTPVVQEYDPGTTVLITDAYAVGSYRTAQVYLPSYRRIAISRDRRGRLGQIFGQEYDPGGFARATPLDAPAGVDTWIFLDPGDVRDYVADSWRLRVVNLRGSSARVFVWRGGQPIVRSGWIWLQPPAERFSED